MLTAYPQHKHCQSTAVRSIASPNKNTECTLDYKMAPSEPKIAHSVCVKHNLSILQDAVEDFSANENDSLCSEETPLQHVRRLLGLHLAAPADQLPLLMAEENNADKIEPITKDGVRDDKTVENGAAGKVSANS